MIIAIDFDGTIVEHEFPNIGKDVPFAFETIKEIQDNNHDLILWTVRSTDTLRAAVDYCDERGVSFLGVNENPSQKFWSGSPKAFAHVFIDDAALGCPLIYPSNARRPFADWVHIRDLLKSQNII